MTHNDANTIRFQNTQSYPFCFTDRFVFPDFTVKVEVGEGTRKSRPCLRLSLLSHPLATFLRAHCQPQILQEIFLGNKLFFVSAEHQQPLTSIEKKNKNLPPTLLQSLVLPCVVGKLSNCVMNSLGRVPYCFPCLYISTKLSTQVRFSVTAQLIVPSGGVMSP